MYIFTNGYLVVPALFVGKKIFSHLTTLAYLLTLINHVYVCVHLGAPYFFFLYLYIYLYLKSCRISPPTFFFYKIMV